MYLLLSIASIIIPHVKKILFNCVLALVVVVYNVTIVAHRHRLLAYGMFCQLSVIHSITLVYLSYCLFLSYPMSIILFDEVQLFFIYLIVRIMCSPRLN